MIRAADDFPSFFTPKEEYPFIIDCGANIGVSVLEWKHRWPTSSIVCFEPDPHAFELLEKNIEKNDLPGVKCYCLALSDHEGHSTLYGQLHRGGDSRGNSLCPEWGRRQDTGETSVQCVPLGPYLNDRHVSFLKLDIEGMEETVLRDVFPKLHQVDAIYAEVHVNEQLQHTNACARIEKLLLDAEFLIETEDRFQPHALPESARAWQTATNAQQSQIMAWKAH